MNLHISIDMAQNANGSCKERGDLLENLSKIIFEKLQYNVVREIRKTGVEIDLSARHKFSNKSVYIECKAHTDTLSADVISKLIGSANIHSYDESILVTTGPLSKDAKGLVDGKNNNPALKNFSIYQDEDIIEILTSNGVTKDYRTLSGLSNIKNIQGLTLLITEISYYWLIKIHPNNFTIANTIIVFDAKTGEEITNYELLRKISETENSYKSYEWRVRKNIDLDSNSIQEEINSIIPVIGGDDWFDTRPARAIDFVGRVTIISDIVKYYCDVVANATGTRVFAVSSPSGLGKSSLILKIEDESKKKFGKNIFNFSIDVRSALSERYIDIVLFKLFKSMNDTNFIKIDISKLIFSNINDFFNNDEIINALGQLQREKKLVVIIFDQFEEIFIKEELVKVFYNAKLLCFLLSSLNANIVAGFAWKTDFSISPDHPVYHIWNEMQNIRKEFTIHKFNDKESQDCMKKYITNSKLNIGRILQKFLIVQSAGLPWLLKKLCIHIENTYTNVEDQLSIIFEGLQREKIFDQDISGLSTDEHNCLKAIALNAPADYFEMLENYGNNVDTVIQKRLIIKKGNKLVLYWDIFKDYILKIPSPAFDFNLLPIVSYKTFISAMQIISSKNSITIVNLSSALRITEGTAINLIVDFAKYDLINKFNEYYSLKDRDISNNISKLTTIYRNHVVYRQIKNIANLTFDEFKNIFSTIYDYTGNTLSQYINILFNWFVNLDLVIDNRTRNKGSVLNHGYVVEATYKRIISLIKNFNNGLVSLDCYSDRKCKYSIRFLQRINCINIQDGAIKSISDIKVIIEEIKQIDLYKNIEEYYLNNHNGNINDCTRFIQIKTNTDQQYVSLRRNINWLHSWYNNIQKKEEPSLFDNV